MSSASKFFALSILLSGASAAPSIEALEGYSFKQYVKDFHKKYSDEKDMAVHEKAFLQRLNHIIQHNARGASWVENVNEFTDETSEEYKGRKGINKAALFKSRSAKTGRKPKVPRTDLPHSVDWRDAGVVTSVKNQGHCGSCWAFAATECLESHIAMQTGILFTLSEQEFASCVDNVDECGGTGGCEGATMELAYQYAADNGLVTEWTTPYISYGGSDFECTLADDGTPIVATISGYTDITTNSYDELMEAVATVGPVGITVDASAWSSYAGGVFDGCNQEQPDLDHGVLLVGYGTDQLLGDYWLVRNSWGPVWGEKGYIRLARTDSEATRCGSDVTPQDGVACKGDNTTETVCGTCGILYDAAYPTGGALA